MTVKFIAGQMHMKEDTSIVDGRPGDLIKCGPGLVQEYILTSSEIKIEGRPFKVAIPTLDTLTRSEIKASGYFTTMLNLMDT